LPTNPHDKNQVSSTQNKAVNWRLLALTIAALFGFAANSLLCRLALRDGAIDALSFTVLRIVSGALVLSLLVLLQRGRLGGNWISAVALATYALTFSLAYVSLSTGTGALILFDCVQLTMIVVGLLQNERPAPLAWIGLLISLCALIALVAPGISAPPLLGALLMAVAGIAWGAYSLRGRGVGNALENTAGNFLRACPLVLLIFVFKSDVHLSTNGVTCALLSGVVASGFGYALWYSALPSLSAFRAATVQLAVPVVAALGGIVFLGEVLTPRLALAGSAILGGIILATLVKSRSVTTSHAAQKK